MKALVRRADESTSSLAVQPLRDPATFALRERPRFTDQEKTPLLVLAAHDWPPPLALRPPHTEHARVLRVASAGALPAPRATSTIVVRSVPVQRSTRSAWYVSCVLGVLLAMNAVQQQPRAAEAVDAEPTPPIQESAAAPILPVHAAEGPASSAPATVPHARRPEPTVATTVESLTRSGNAARARGHLDEAARLYTRALQSNRAFFPASLGLADSQWELGNKNAAQLEYRRMVRSFPASMIPDHARLRAGQTS